MKIDLKRLINGYWHPICHRSEVVNSRDFVRLQLYDEEVVAFNDGVSVVVFDNLCPHRGARIFDGPSGNSRFLCRYHGWSYDKGKVRSGTSPALDATCGQPRLAEWHTQWLGNLLFAAKEPIMPLDAQLDIFGSDLTAIASDIFERADFNAFIYECDWKIAVENALEPYHVGLIHADSLDTLKLMSGANSYAGKNSLWKTTIGNDRIQKGLDRIEKMFDLNFQYKGYFSFYIFPFSMISSTYGFSYSLQNFFPTAESNTTYFVSRFYKARLKENVRPEVMAPFFQNAAQVNRRVFDEDHQICRRVSARSWRTDLGHLRENEEKVAHFRTSMREFVLP